MFTVSLVLLLSTAVENNCAFLNASTFTAVRFCKTQAMHSELELRRELVGETLYGVLFVESNAKFQVTLNALHMPEASTLISRRSTANAADSTWRQRSAELAVSVVRGTCGLQ